MDNINAAKISFDDVEFNESVRVYIIILLGAITLYVFSYMKLLKYHCKKERDSWDHADVDAKAHRVALYICAAMGAISIGAILMLPLSMLGNEVVHLYPRSYWVQWINGALVHTIWQVIFIVSQISFIVMAPFSWLFTESEGFSSFRRHKRGSLLPRIYETVAILFIALLIIFCLICTVDAFINPAENYSKTFLNGYHYFSNAFAYCLCFFVLFTITCCTPKGLVIIFDWVGSLLVKPVILGDNNEKIQELQLSKDLITRRLNANSRLRSRRMMSSRLIKQQVGSEEMEAELVEINKEIASLERQRNVSSAYKNVWYPLLMLVVLALTCLSLLFVVVHMLQFTFWGDHELHPSTVNDHVKYDYRNPLKQMNICRQIDEKGDQVPQYCRKVLDDPHSHDNTKLSETNHQVFYYGAKSLSSFGIYGTIFELILISYNFFGSLVGYYFLIGQNLIPEIGKTPITTIIFNCVSFQLLACSLPVMSRVLGITMFELQGSFGQLPWLADSGWICLFHLIYTLTVTLCLIKKFTFGFRCDVYKALHVDMWKERWQRVVEVGRKIKKWLDVRLENEVNIQQDLLVGNVENRQDAEVSAKLVNGKGDISTSSEASSSSVDAPISPQNRIFSIFSAGCLPFVSPFSRVVE